MEPQCSEVCSFSKPLNTEKIEVLEALPNNLMQRVVSFVKQFDADPDLVLPMSFRTSETTLIPKNQDQGR